MQYCCSDSALRRRLPATVRRGCPLCSRCSSVVVIVVAIVAVVAIAAL
jgi:hypothetical protein